MFSPGGLAVALIRGCELKVDAPGLERPVTITEDDLTCAECDRSVDPTPRTQAKFIEYNSVLTDGISMTHDAT